MHAHHATPRTRDTVAAVFRDHAYAFARTVRMPTVARKAIRDICACRTAVLGGHVEECTHCKHTILGYNSCRNRHCPTCQPGRQAVWIAQRQARVLPIHHFHVVFTLPAELRPLARAHPREVYNALFAAAKDTLMTLGQQELQGQLGITMVLHTWTRELQLHPHVHCVVAGGALSSGPEPVWTSSSPRFLFPVAIMRTLFRGKLIDLLHRHAEAGDLHTLSSEEWADLRQSLFDKTWVVFAKRTFGGAKQVFAYLGRYTHRVAISDARIHAYDGQSVRFRTRGDHTCTLSATEFIRRFLLHILPHGFRKIRHYGLLAPANVNTRLEIARAALIEASPPDDDSPTQEDVDPGDQAEEDKDDATCPNCQIGTLRRWTIDRRTPRWPRGPPRRGGAA